MIVPRPGPTLVSAVSAPHEAEAWFEVSLIPTTLQLTTLGRAEVELAKAEMRRPRG